MEKMKKELKIISIVILAFSLLSLIRLIVNAAVTKFAVDVVPDGLLTEEFARIILIITWIISVLFILPEIYIGFTGLQVSSKKVEKRGHLIWALVIFAFSLIGIISGITNFFQPNIDVLNNVLSLIDSVVSVIIFYMFYRIANKIHKADNIVEQ